MNIPAAAIKYRLFTIMGMIILIFLGISSFLIMPRAEDPAIDMPLIATAIIYPGATPVDIEKQVVEVVESALNELEEVKVITSNIKENVAMILTEFDYGVDSDVKKEKIEGVITAIRDKLPDGIQEIRIRKYSTTDVRPLQIALISATAPYKDLWKVGIALENKLKKISGVRRSEVVACPQEEVRIALNPIKMSERNVALIDIENAVRSTNANIPGGSINVSNRSFDILTSGNYGDLEQIKNTIIKSYQGKLVHLKDVANIYMAYEDKKWTARYNGKPCILINLQQKEQVDIYSVIEPAKAVLKSMDLPENMALEIIYDQSKEVQKRTNGFKDNLLQGILLVGIIIFLVLGIRSASLVMIAIPFSMLTGLWVVYMSGFIMEQMTIAALIVALGLLVDNSIAIVENIERFLRKGYTPKEAAIKGTQQLIAPVASATLTTILAFLPILGLNNTTGAFIRSLPVTVIATLIASFLIAITVTPFFATLILKKRETGEQPKTTFAFRLLQSFVDKPFTKALNWTMHNRLLSVGLTLASLIGALSLFPTVGVTFFPKAEKPVFRIQVDLPEGFNQDATTDVVKYVEAVLAEQSEVAYYVANIGSSNPKLYYNMLTKTSSKRYADILVFTKNYDPKESTLFLDHLRSIFDNHPKAQISITEFSQGPIVGAPIGVDITGESLDKLKEYAAQVTKKMEKTLGLINIRNPLKIDKTDLFFDINKEKALLLGVPIHIIDQTIRSFVQGRNIGVFQDNKGNEFDLVARMDFKDQFQITDFEKISVPSLKGFFVPLKQVADLVFKQAPSNIAHTDFERSVYIEADVATGYLVTDLVNELKRPLDFIEWNEGYTYKFKGEVTNKKESFGGMGIAAGLALLLILSVLIIHFQSFSQPLIVFSALPFAIIGAILALFLTGIPFSFMAFIGLTSLIGIAINNSLVLVDYANELRADGKNIARAIKEAAKIRFIPIFMTTLTTILGLLPLTLAGGSLWAPMGWVIIGGLISSTFFVLLIVPVLYQWFTPTK